MMPLSVVNEYTRECVAEQRMKIDQVGGSRARCAGKTFQGQGIEIHHECGAERAGHRGAQLCARETGQGECFNGRRNGT
jgi:hypothetical protein